MWTAICLAPFVCFHLLTAQVIFESILERNARQSSCDNGNLLKCEARNPPSINCNTRSRYRTADGTCNNLQNPSWGRESACFNRILSPAYADGVRQVRQAVGGGELPRPRVVSLNIHHTTPAPDPNLTPLFMLHGQFISHDINLTPFFRADDNTILDCCGADSSHPWCSAIQVGGPGDPFYNNVNRSCLSFARSIPCDLCIQQGQASPIYQINSVTSYIDGSVIYGSTDDVMSSVRLFRDGKLRWQEADRGRALLPQDFENLDQCQVNNTGTPCFKAGDIRVNQHLQLTGLHTVWMRFHNYVADQLKSAQRRWNDERLFQEARRIVIAVLQLITYDEYLPWIIGPRLMNKFNLWLQNEPRFTEYDPSVDATMATDFSTAPYRYGHSMVQTVIPMWNMENRLLRNTFFQPFELYENILDNMMYGLASSGRAERADVHLVPDVTEFLYRRSASIPFGQDLASLNVNRGRDHGLRPYVDYLRLCTCQRVTNFEQLCDFMPRENVDRLRKTYRDVRDIDLFSGGLSETPVNGGVVGPTFACIIARQFARLKFGDRFYFEHRGQAGSFTMDQLNEIKKMTLSKIFCIVLDINRIQKYSMRKVTNRNPERLCRDAEYMDFRPWTN